MGDRTQIDPTLRDLLKLSAKAFGGPGGDIPAKVVAYDAATQTVDAAPRPEPSRSPQDPPSTLKSSA